MSLHKKVFLSLLTGILFGISFPPNQFGIISCIAFVPLFILLDNLNGFKSTIRFLYLTFFTASIFALYWVGGFTHHKDIYLMLAGASLLFFQPFVLMLPFWIYILISKWNNKNVALLFFPAIAVTFEWLYTFSEFAFPWMLLGNTLTYEFDKIQFIEITGVYALSFWVMSLNVLIYYFLINLSNYNFKKKLKFKFAILFIFFAPNFYKSDFSPNYKNEIKVGIIQPNIDPWEKWSPAIDDRWNDLISILPNLNKSDSIDIYILPESAITYDLLKFDFMKYNLSSMLEDANSTLLSGFVKVQYQNKNEATVTSNYIESLNKYYESYNSIFYLNPKNSEVETYSKIRLVPFAERIPFAETFSFLIKPIAWGIGISNWGKGKDTTIFKFKDSRFASLVCYESIFPEFISKFVKKGAEFIIIVTNDSWYDDSAGPIQHNRFAILRAIENRRWIVRCANGGISSIISPKGEIISQTKMFDKTILKGNIYSEKNQTFYSKHGDWFVYSSVIISILVLLFSFIKKYFHD